MITAKTRLVAMIGQPIAQVKSPDYFNRAFAEAGAERAMIPMEIAPEAVAAFVEMVRDWDNLDGFVVTIPHKQAIAELADEVSPRAKWLGAANVVRREPDSRLVADMVDGLGYVAAIRANDFEPKGKHALVIGAGAAGSAIAHALCEEGVAALAISELDWQRGDRFADRLREAFPSVEITTTCGDIGAYDLVANATPLGMRPNDPLPLGRLHIAALKETALVTDAVTSPEVTPFLEAAQALGLKIQTGPEMSKAQMGLLGRHMGVL